MPGLLGAMETMGPEKVLGIAELTRIIAQEGGRPHGCGMHLGVLTSGGDAPGMNAAIRAVTRSALRRKWICWGIYGGYEGLLAGGTQLRALQWHDVSGILHKGGTILGSARSAEFRQRGGRLRAVKNMLAVGLDRLVVIGGDGSLTGAQMLYEEWSDLLAELVNTGQISAELAARHPMLRVVGLPGSIDNDLPGIDVSIGADTALNRVVEATDRLFSTADSHRRIFVVEVMGRRCGYLTVMASLASGAEVAIVPESPLGPDWPAQLCQKLKQAREAGRRASIVLVAEGAQDTQGAAIGSQQVQQAIHQGLGEEVRVTILGHVQRGGAPTAFDRNQSTLLGAAAVETLAEGDGEPVLVGMRGNHPYRARLKDCLELSQKVSEALKAGDEQEAILLRGHFFQESLQTRKVLGKVCPGPFQSERRCIGVMHAGGPAPGMNTAVRAAVRMLADQGHTVLAIQRGLKGLVEGELREIGWMDVSGWSSRGGAELGTNRKLLSGHDLYAVARHIEQFQLQGLLIVGGLAAYETAATLRQQEEHYPSFGLPVVCVPATIDNNLPGTDLSIGTDTALNSIVEVVDKIKQSAVASQRCFIVEVMGRRCGYLALMAALATGAEQVYLPEEALHIERLLADLHSFREGFRRGRRVGLVIRNECASSLYNTPFIANLFEEEGRCDFDVRQAILGHLQQGGDPTAFDRTLAVRLTAQACQKLLDMLDSGKSASLAVGLQHGETRFSDLRDLKRWLDPGGERPLEQWWQPLQGLMQQLAEPES